MMSRPTRHVVACLIIAGLCAAVYGISLTFSFAFDDALVITGNDFISSPANLKGLFSRDYFLISGEETYRPVVTVSYYVDHLFWRLNPAGYHLTSLVVHTLAAIAVYALVLTLVKRFSFAVAAAAVLVVHPVSTEAVVSPGFREDLFTGLFYFTAVSLFIAFNRARGRRGHCFYALCVISYLLALFSKEMALSLPLLVLAVIWTVPSARGWKRSLLWPRWAGLCAVTVLYALVRFVLLSNPAAPHAEYPAAGIAANVLTMARVFISYVRELFFPIGLSAEYAIAPASAGDSRGLAAAAALLVIIALALWKRWRWPVVSLGVLWFFIALIPVANIVPLYNIKADRYLYIPLAGFCLFLGACGAALAERADKPFTQRLPIWALSLAVIALALLAGFRASDWRSPVALWNQVLERNPGSFRAHINLGRASAQMQRYDQAILHYEHARELRPNEPMLYNNLGAAYSRIGRPDLAVEEYRKALALYPRYYNAQTNLALAYVRLGKPEEAEAALSAAARIRPLSATTYSRMASALLTTGRAELARDYIETALRLSPNDPVAHDTKGRLLLQEGDVDGAIREHLSAVRGDPRAFAGYLNLGNAYRAKGLIPEAEQAYARALELNPSYWKAAYNLAMLALERGAVDEAAEFHRATIKMAPRDPATHELLVRVHLDLAEAYAAKGDRQSARRHYLAFLEGWKGDDALKEKAQIELAKLDR